MQIKKMSDPYKKKTGIHVYFFKAFHHTYLELVMGAAISYKISNGFIIKILCFWKISLQSL